MKEMTQLQWQKHEAFRCGLFQAHVETGLQSSIQNLTYINVKKENTVKCEKSSQIIDGLLRKQRLVPMTSGPVVYGNLSHFSLIFT